MMIIERFERGGWASKITIMHNKTSFLIEDFYYDALAGLLAGRLTVVFSMQF
jgi:hypothetical protein